jgi:hypothetical protein
MKRPTLQKEQFTWKAALLVLGCAVGLSTAPGQAQTWTSYDANLGTLPEAQGFTKADEGGSPAPTVADGWLNQGPTAYFARQYWFSISQVPIDFVGGFTLEATFKILESSYEPDTCIEGQRAGYYLGVSDKDGREIDVGIGCHGLFIGNDDREDVSTAPFTSFDTTDASHTYRLVVTGDGGTLYIDDAPVLFEPLGEPTSAPANRVYFGDGSVRGWSQTQLRLFRYTLTGASLVYMGARAKHESRGPGRRLTQNDRQTALRRNCVARRIG